MFNIRLLSFLFYDFFFLSADIGFREEMKKFQKIECYGGYQIVGLPYHGSSCGVLTGLYGFVLVYCILISRSTIRDKPTPCRMIF
jgi:hypothetical protein